jgi:hypothetical protein
MDNFVPVPLKSGAQAALFFRVSPAAGFCGPGRKGGKQLFLARF